MVKAAVQGTFRETGERIAEITGAPVPVRSIEEVLQQAAEDFDAFYVERTPPTSTGTGTILVDRKSTRLNSSHGYISYAVFCLIKNSPLASTGHNQPEREKASCV